jgi:VWFA-related protein
MPKALRASAILTVSLLALCEAQVAQAPAQPLLRITPALVQVEVVVTDSAGHHAGGLRRDDFEIQQDGQPQPLTSFSSFFENDPAAPKPARAGEKNAGGPAPPTTAAEVKRTVALVVDDLAVRKFGTLDKVRDGLRRYVKQRMQPGDQVAVLRTGGGIAALEQFTTDPQLLLEAINEMHWQVFGGGLPDIQRLGQNSGGRPRVRTSSIGYTLDAHAALDRLRQVLEGMRRLPGRKAVVFFSDPLRMDLSINQAIDGITDQAIRSGVSIYTIDPGASKSKAASETEGLGALAARTGGLFFSNRGEIAECIAQAADDQLGYYRLGYVPPEATFAKDPADARFHKVTVRVHTPGLQVRGKSGFSGLPDEAPGSEPASVATAKTGEEQLLQALASPFSASGVRVRLTSMFFQTHGTGPFVRSLLHLNPRDLTFTRDPVGIWHATIDVVIAAYRGFQQRTETSMVRQGPTFIRRDRMMQPFAHPRQQHREITLNESQYRKALEEGLVYALNEPIREPGLFLVRVAVRDAASKRVGSASQSLEVPDTRKGQLALSGITLQLATPDLLRSMLLDPAAASSENGAGQWFEGGPATRRFLPGQSIYYGYVVINPRVKKPATAPQVKVQVRVFRNGALYYTSPLEHQLTAASDDPACFSGSGVLQLKGGLTPGEYLLQVEVTDQLRSRKTALATQWCDFEVTANSSPGHSEPPDGGG